MSGNYLVQYLVTQLFLNLPKHIFPPHILIIVSKCNCIGSSSIENACRMIPVQIGGSTIKRICLTYCQNIIIVTVIVDYIGRSSNSHTMQMRTGHDTKVLKIRSSLIPITPRGGESLQIENLISWMHFPPLANFNQKSVKMAEQWVG